MQLIILIIIFLTVSIVQATDYGISNEQLCTNTPFVANFPHNCSRTRLTQDVTIPNTNQVLYITIMIASISSNNTSFTITKSSNYNQTVYLTTLRAFVDGYTYINNQTEIPDFEFNVTLYSYDTSSGQLTQTNSPSIIPPQEFPLCYMKNQSLQATNITRAYYLYTNETNLNIDLSKSSSGIPSQFLGFDLCFAVVTSLTTSAIVLIVLISVFSLVTVILVLICLKKQITELIHIWKNWLIQKLGMTPKQTIDG